MTADEMQAIEAAIAAQDAAGKPWTNQTIRDATGISYKSVSHYLKRRRRGLVTPPPLDAAALSPEALPPDPLQTARQALVQLDDDLDAVHEQLYEAVSRLQACDGVVEGGPRRRGILLAEDPVRARRRQVVEALETEYHRLYHERAQALAALQQREAVAQREAVRSVSPWAQPYRAEDHPELAPPPPRPIEELEPWQRPYHGASRHPSAQETTHA